MVSEEEVALRRFCEDSSNSNIRKGTVPLISSWSLGRHGGTLKIMLEASVKNFIKIKHQLDCP